jgi:hypothetical protein
MKWIWFNFAALIAFFSLVLHGAPWVPVLAGIGLAAAANYYRLRSRTA